ncbi:hypothetical protein T440DRAFT_471460 [Plenodomus tracheiphilus IPT5]|uniref:BTB domain-containing protein n=1 Tax=Plenodomus tracheiphilus IPT5 TaxID=1408161 RepID=A0A6A7AV43_9PLEO|nr:hypothetical protein T440DRAFT_471460 [Plenodomus tracheiphilus IPT5]
MLSSLANTAQVSLSDNSVSATIPVSCNVYRDAFKSMITITVGPSGATEVYHVYRGLLCFHAHYFRALINGNFQESRSADLRIATVPAHVFEVFFCWMQTRALPCVDLQRVKGYDVLIEAYLFADYYLAVGFKNALLDKMCHLKGFQVIASSSSLIYECTTDEDPLRRLLLKVGIALGFVVFSDLMDYESSNFHDKFMFDVLKSLHSAREPHVLVDELDLLTQWCEEQHETFCETYHDHRVHEARLAIRGPRSVRSPHKRFVLHTDLASTSLIMQPQTRNTESNR